MGVCRKLCFLASSRAVGEDRLQKRRPFEAPLEDRGKQNKQGRRTTHGGLLRAYGYAAGVAALVFETEAELRPGGWQGEALGPFQDYYRGVGEDIFEAQGFEVVEIFDAVEVAVIDLVSAAVDMDQRKGGAGDFVFFRRAQPSYDAFG